METALLLPLQRKEPVGRVELQGQEQGGLSSRLMSHVNASVPLCFVGYRIQGFV